MGRIIDRRRVMGGGSNKDLIDLIERDIVTLNIPNGTTKIGDYAFYHYTVLTSITIPNSVTSIGSGAFAYCTGLTSIGGVGSGASIEIPDSVTSIDNNAFAYCTGLTSVNLPQNITNIKNYTFDGCRSLVNVEISNGVTSIGAYAFRYCGFTTLTIPDSVLYIHGENAISDCPNLESVIIGRGIKSIGSYAFTRCRNLKEVTILAVTPPTISSTTFGGNHAERKFYVPAESLEAYKTANVWKNYADVIFPIEE